MFNEDCSLLATKRHLAALVRTVPPAAVPSRPTPQTSRRLGGDRDSPGAASVPPLDCRAANREKAIDFHEKRGEQSAHIARGLNISGLSARCQIDPVKIRAAFPTGQDE